MHAKNGTLSKSVIAGAIGGLAAAYVMNRFQSLWTAVAKELSDGQPDQQKSSDSGDDATVKTANRISQQVFDHELTGSERKWAGPAVHYGFGTVVGAVYGLLAEKVPAAGLGHGTVYGSAVWLFADEIGVPALGLSQSYSPAPLSSHVKALASHLVYGVTTDLARLAILKARHAASR